jgi:hypothetical protein
MDMKRNLSDFIEAYEEVSGQSPRTTLEAENYFMACMLYLVRTDTDVITAGLREAEQRLIQRGLAGQYFSALRDVLELSDSMQETEELLALLHASAEERTSAVAIVMNMGENDEDEFWDYIVKHH